MNPQDAGTGGSFRPALGFREFVAIVAFTMSLGALSMDSMLPAFGQMRTAFGLADPNEMQLTVVVFMAGFGVAQLLYGPLSDNWGRRPALMLGLGIFTLGSLMAIAAPSFEVLIAARLVQGIGAAATRIITTAITRDRFEGAEMARVMALIMMVFIVVPVFAPSIGSLILLAGGWRLVFAGMLAVGLVVALWFHLRMPETLHPEYRMPLSARRIGAAALRCIRTRQSFAAATSTGLLYGCLMAYIASAEQIFAGPVYGLGPLFPVVFGLIAALMGGASFTNSRLVRRLGIRRLLHTGQCGFVACALVMVGLALGFDGRPPLVAFCLVLTACLFLFSLTMPNFNALAMSPLGDIAGTASSLIGFYTTIGGAMLGGLVARFFDGTVIPLSLGFLVLGGASLAVTLWAEGGRLFGDAPAAPH
ncbi:multidrug effflux MFS transporter [Zavarzinia compransoris]|uniref:MFS transporter n=1 Tax=Zavarzinia compransoris TaxID=1264899 RepID=A0A317EEU2_9PROT|nr:multidrug effflux MFS transporter [Zavarzinia compransoris]PWR23893.1 MFS transporter [Zavarzinia compransoris]TDP48137.1 DHA1 family bicyclomycin/chloramphenicol resistance-like MFS transporter [Zavarzinia compransoris]